ncbi:MAG TPA: hypothetical protein VFH03_04970 [Actinoplanes sp.]|nr:hypothetical protein [Actinoplanes sp.]
MTRLIIAAGWLAAAVLAVLVGVVAISVIGDGITSPLTRPLSRAEVERELAQATSAPSVPRSPSPSAPASASAPRSFATAGGTVVVRCVAGRAEIVSMSPAQGFEVHDGGDGAEGEFRGISDDHDRVEVEASCRGGRPALEERDD